MAEEDAVKKIAMLRGVTWRWRDDAPDDVKSTPGIGVVAQDVEKVFPALVHERPDGIKEVEYQGLIAALVEAVKELDARLRRVEELLARERER